LEEIPMGMTMTDCGPVTRDLIARLTAPTRNRYYYGKLLDSYHLELEQLYGNANRWMLNRLTLGAGVLCGLPVQATADKTRIRVGAGVAIDFYGREIIVPQPSQPFDPTQPTDDCARPVGDPIRDGTVTLFLCYHECEAEPAPAMVDECGDPGCENGLVRERYRLRVGSGTPMPPGTITDAQCKIIRATPAAGVTRRTVICNTLTGACAAPDESCIPIATLELRGGLVEKIDICTFRTTVYSNAVLLDLILCLAARVDECCGPVAATKTIAIQDGDGQTGPAGQILARPLVARVFLGGAVVANEEVTFQIDSGGGAIGGSPTTLGTAPFKNNTNAAGDATLPSWRLGATGVAQRVKASIANGAFVIFNARADRAPVENPPVVLAIWVPNGTQLSANAPNPARRWTAEFRERRVLQITFDRKMRPTQLSAPDPWLRMYAFTSRAEDPAVNAPVLLTRINLRYAGTVTPGILNAAGVTEEYRLEVDPNQFPGLTRFLVQINAFGGNIVEAGGTGLMLDAEFRGTKLSLAQLDAIWPATGTTASDFGTFSTIPGGPDTLPQSGDTIPGGRFHSWFEVLL
jgi:hypothetical protein